MEKESGFTIVELILVIGLILTLGGFMLSFGLGFYRSQVLEDATARINTVLREAQGKAFYEKRDASFGVRFKPDSYIFFQGESFSGRVSELDLTYDLPEPVSISGPDEVVFTQGSGTSTFSGVLTLKLGVKKREIEINSEGKIGIQK
jgi:type II secretory pathway pseudopilin PulG